jgi:8-oxo-dGTP diphosphatase
MMVRNIEIRVENRECAHRPDAAAVADDARLTDEHSVRSAYAEAIKAAERGAPASVDIPAFGCREGGISATASGKIGAQEIIRFARRDAANPREIVLCHAGPGSFEEFSRAVTGYITHFTDVLSWGPLVTVDAVIEVPAGIVLVKRSNPPLGFALPGGFVDYGESLETAVRREAMEETGLDLLDLVQFHTYSDPGRDPRFHTVTTVFSARAVGTPRAGDDAAEIRVARPEEIAKLDFAFDHKRVLDEYMEWRKRRR